MAKDFAPWSAETAQGIKTDPVDSNIDVKQQVVPALSVGTINAKTGEWTGVIESDNQFTIDPTHAGVPNTGVTLSPQAADANFIDMTGYQDIFIGIRVTNAGTYAVTAVMGPNENGFANLTPINSASNLKGAIRRNDMDTVLLDSSESMTANVWNIFTIKSQLANQKNMQFNVTNGSGGSSDIQFAYLRVV